MVALASHPQTQVKRFFSGVVVFNFFSKEHSMVGSLAGAAASQKVTEVRNAGVA